MTVTIDIDHREKLRAARDQRQRPTCLVFAASAAHEASRGSPDYLSAEYLFYSGAKRSHKDPTRGLSAVAVSEALGQDGQPEEIHWPYLPTTPDTTAWQPPTLADPTHTAQLQFRDRTVHEVREELLAGSPVLLVMSLTTAMYSPGPGGIVQSMSNDMLTARRHAVLAVGAGHSEDRKYILVRNSWGESWGNAGHGWIHEPYLQNNLLTTATIA